jgi:hypothetical protein
MLIPSDWCLLGEWSVVCLVGGVEALDAMQRCSGSVLEPLLRHWIELVGYWSEISWFSH